MQAHGCRALIIKRVVTRRKKCNLSVGKIEVINNSKGSTNVGGSELQTYCKFEMNIKPETHLHSQNSSARRALTKIRVGAHKMASKPAGTADRCLQIQSAM